MKWRRLCPVLLFFLLGGAAAYWWWQGWLERSGSGPSVYELRDEMAEAMIADVGIFRTEAELVRGVERLKESS